MWKEILFGNYKRILTYKTKPEDRLTINLSSILVTLTIQNKLNAVWFHVPNEAGRNTKFFTMMQKAKGVIPGVSDFIFIGANNLALELKCKNNKLSDKQEAFRDWCAEHNIPYESAYTIEEALAILNKYGVLSDENHLFSLTLCNQAEPTLHV